MVPLLIVIYLKTAYAYLHLIIRYPLLTSIALKICMSSFFFSLFLLTNLCRRNNSWTRVEIQTQDFHAPSSELIESNMEDYCLSNLFERGIFSRNSIYLALKRLFRYNNSEFFNLSAIEQRDEVTEQINKQVQT